MKSLPKLKPCLIILLLFITSITFSQSKSPKNKNISEYKLSKYDEAMGLAEWEFNLTKDPITHTVPKQKILEAINFEKARCDNQTSAMIGGMIWEERGPNNIGGRTRSIMVDPNDPTRKTVWAGGVDGGLWKTTDITATSPNWTPINDLFANLAITCMAYDSTNNDTIYFGTGEGFYNVDAARGFGIWRTIDGGATWIQLSSTIGSSFNFINKIVVNPTNHKLYVGTRTGIYLSSNAGNTFTLIGYSGKNISDIELSSTCRIHIGIGDLTTTREYHYTDNDGTAWDQIQNNFTTIVTSGNRVELAIAPSNSNILYALVGTGGAVKGIYKSINSGVTWIATTQPNWVDQSCSSPVSDFTRGQSWYDLSIAVNPTNANNVIIGGVDLLKTSDGGVSWIQISSWIGGCGRQYVHADQQIVYYEPGSSTVSYFGNDGGIYRTSNANATIPTIIEKNDNYNVTQYYSVAIHPTSSKDFLIGGAQDNGSHIIQASGIGGASQVTGGDGAFCHIEKDEPQYMYTSGIKNLFYRSDNGGISFSSVINDSHGPFISAWDFDDRNNILYAAYSVSGSPGGYYRRYTNMHGTPIGTSVFLGSTVGTVTHVKVSPNVDTTVYFGTTAGNVFKSKNANGTPTLIIISNGLPSSPISCIEIEKGNENHILVTYSNYGENSVWQTYDGGVSWKSIEGNLPDLPVRWVIFNPSNNHQALLATEIGVYSTDYIDTIGSTNWGINSSGMPNVRVDMLKLRASDNVIAAATHGRGMFTTDVFSSIAMPVELIKFTVNQKYNDVLLDWSTASEKNNIGFDIERSVDAISWSKITFVEGKGTNYQVNNYSYTDDTAFKNGNTLYYRLKQIDINGFFKYSDIQVVENTINFKIIKAIPNPFENKLTILYYSMNDRNITFKVMNSIGQIIDILDVHSREGNCSSVFNTSEYCGGVYFISMFSGDNYINYITIVKN